MMLQGSAAATEATGVLLIHEKSVKELNILYITYIRDGDVKAYKAIVKSQSYAPKTKS